MLRHVTRRFLVRYPTHRTCAPRSRKGVVIRVLRPFPASGPQPNPDFAPPPRTLPSQLSSAVPNDRRPGTAGDPADGRHLHHRATQAAGTRKRSRCSESTPAIFQIQVDLKGGTQFLYLFTRGSWQPVERARSGLRARSAYSVRPRRRLDGPRCDRLSLVGHSMMNNVIWVGRDVCRESDRDRID